MFRAIQRAFLITDIVKKMSSAHLPTEEGGLLSLSANNQPLTAQLPRNTFPLAPNQLGVAVEEEQRLETSIYNRVIAFQFEGTLHIQNFLDAIKLLINRHPTLRMGLNIAANEQFVTDAGDWETQLYADRIYGDDELKDTIYDILHKPFQILKPPLIRSVLIKIDTEKWYWMFVVHPALFDSISRVIFLKELSVIYNSLQDNVKIHLPVSEIQFGDFCRWQHTTLEDLSGQHIFPWLDYLKDQSAGQLPYFSDKKEDIPPYIAGQVNFEVSAIDYHQLQKLAHEQNTTVYLTLLAIFTSFIHHYTQQDDFTIASLDNYRSLFGEQLLNAIGNFSNTFFYRSKIFSDQTFIEYLSYTKNNINDFLKKNFVLPFSRLSRDVAKNNITPGEILFFMEPEGYKELALNGLKVTPLENLPMMTGFDFVLQMRKMNLSDSNAIDNIDSADSTQQLTGSFIFRSKYFPEKWVEDLKNNFLLYLRDIVRNPQKRLVDMSYLSSEQVEQIIKTAGKEVNFDKKKGIHQYFEEYAAIQPNAIAAVFSDKKITYDDLNKMANRYAHHFINNEGVSSGDIIGICMPYSLEIIISMLAVLKSGAIILFLEHGNSEEQQILRRKKIAKANPKLIIVNNETNLFISEIVDKENIHSVGEELPNTSANFNVNANPKVSADYSASKALITFTSGTTGTPKGVIGNHAGLTNWLLNSQRYVSTAPNIYVAAPPTFDAFTWEILCLGLGNGKTIYMLPFEQRLNINTIKTFFEKNRITTATFTPTFLRNLSPDKFPTIKQLFLVGEKLPFYLIEPWLKRGVNITNGYGPSEVTVGATLYNCRLNENVSIGKPISNVYIYILNPFTHKPVPLGVWGEIAIGGVGVTEYLDNPELTKEKFIADPFDANKIVYLSGDLGRFALNGNLECSGRIDRQIKIAGARIEPEEIEKELKQSPYIEDIFVTSLSVNERKQLVAYIILSDVKTTENIPLLLCQNLIKAGYPSIKIPKFFIVKVFPRTINGKIDEKQLAESFIEPDYQGQTASPVTDTEIIISDMWRDLLNIPEKKLDIYTTFVEYGGHSLLVYELLARLNSAFPRPTQQSLDLAPRNMLKMSIHELAAKIDSTIQNDQNIENGRNPKLLIHTEWAFGAPSPLPSPTLR